MDARSLSCTPPTFPPRLESLTLCTPHPPQPFPRLVYLGPLQPRPQLRHHHLRPLPRHPRLFVPLCLHLRCARLRRRFRVQRGRSVSRVGMLDVDVRGECVGRCAGVRCVGVFVARVEGARVSSSRLWTLVFHAVHDTMYPPRLCISLLLEAPYDRNHWYTLYILFVMIKGRLGCRKNISGPRKMRKEGMNLASQNSDAHQCKLQEDAELLLKDNALGMRI